MAILKAGSRLEGVNFEFDDSPENQLLETMVVAQGEYERHKNRERVIARQRARLQLGYWVFLPPKVIAMRQLKVMESYWSRMM